MISTLYNRVLKKIFKYQILIGARDESGKLVPLDVKKGDKILFGKWSGTEVKMNGEEYLIMKESDIMGIIISGKSKKNK